jgi:6-pyruvoyl-tetrahydropterin synthase
MKIHVEVSASFDAGHRCKTRPRCERFHGHTWKVTVAAPTRTSSDGDALYGDLTELTGELDDRNLDDMLPGLADYTPEILAPVIWERLRLNHPGILRVEVSDGRITAVAS